MSKLYFDFEPTAAYLDDAKRELFCSRLPEARAARIRSPRAVSRRAERAAAEAVLRRILRVAGEQYVALTVAYTESGKPYIDGRPDLSISISHTAHLAAVALVKAEPGTEAPAVGLDIVACGSVPARSAEIASRYFSPAELEDLHTAEGSAAREDAFLSAWCRMEARVKMTGEGIGSCLPPQEPLTRRSLTISPAGVPTHLVAIALASFVDEM